jgi:hypothetical protein
MERWFGISGTSVNVGSEESFSEDESRGSMVGHLPPPADWKRSALRMDNGSRVM